MTHESILIKVDAHRDSIRGTISNSKILATSISSKDKLIGDLAKKNIRITGTISKPEKFTCAITSKMDIKGSVAVGRPLNGELYEGIYEVEPTEEEQILNTKKKVLEENVIVKPIPSNYGKITWDGGALIVS